MRTLLAILAAFGLAIAALHAQSPGDYLIQRKAASGPNTLTSWDDAASSLWGTTSAGAPTPITIGSGLTLNPSTNTLTAGAGSGTVTSVGLSLPAIFTVTNSPVTSSGTLTGTLANQSANLVWAGPASGSAAAPTFRSLATADLPVTVVLTSGSYADPAWITSLAKSKVGLSNVEDTALSTWTGSANLTTLGTIAAGTWQGNAIADGYISSAATWNAKVGGGTGATDNAVLRADGAGGATLQSSLATIADDGTITTPAGSFGPAGGIADMGSGQYKVGYHYLNFYTANVPGLIITDNVFNPSAGTYSSLMLAADGVLEQRGVAGAQELRIMAATGTNWEGLTLAAGASRSTIKPKAGGTGSIRPVDYYLTDALAISSGSGSPESVLTRPPGSVYLRTDGGASTVLYLKESGTGNTGWVAYGAGGGGSGDMLLASAQTVTGAKTYLSATLLMRESGGGTDTITFAAPVLAGNRILTWPSSTGTLALTSQIPSLTGYMTAAAYDPQGSGYTLSGATGTTTGSGAGGSGGLGPILAGGSGADSGTASAVGGNGGTLAISGGNAAAAAGASARGGNASSISVSGGSAAAVTDGSGGDFAARGGDGGVLSLQGGAGYAVGVTAIAGGDGGDLLMYGAAGEAGGAAGGDVITHSGGGSINTRDFGAIQLGFAGQRTTIAGAAEADWTMTLPTGPGSNGQVMTTNGSGGTSWTTVSGGSGGGWVLIASTTVTSNQTHIVFDGCFTGSYECYQIRYNGARSAADDSYFKFYFRDSGSDITSATVGLTYKYYGNSGPYQDNFGDSTGFRMAPYLEVGGNSSTKQVHGVVECWPRAAGPKMCYIRTHYINSYGTGEVPSMSEGHSTLSDNRTTIDGIKIFFDGANTTAGWFGVYGLKQN